MLQQHPPLWARQLAKWVAVWKLIVLRFRQAQTKQGTAVPLLWKPAALRDECCPGSWAWSDCLPARFAFLCLTYLLVFSPHTNPHCIAITSQDPHLFAKSPNWNLFKTSLKSAYRVLTGSQSPSMMVTTVGCNLTKHIHVSSSACIMAPSPYNSFTTKNNQRVPSLSDGTAAPRNRNSSRKGQQ